MDTISEPINEQMFAVVVPPTIASSKGYRSALHSPSSGRGFLVCVPQSIDMGEGHSERGYRVEAAYLGLFNARARADAIPGAVLARFHSREGGDVLIAQRSCYGPVELWVMAGCGSDGVGETIEAVSCECCGLYNDDGEGYDGLCGDCADRAEAEGRWA